jgi:hypothetical protein
MREKLAELLSDDHKRESAEKERTNVVAKAPRSAEARETDTGLPMHSFQTLLRDVGTLAKNRVWICGVRHVDAIEAMTPRAA